MNRTYGFLFLLFISCHGYSQVKMQKTNGGFLFTEDNEKILFYQAEPKNQAGKYERLNYIHPLWSLNGQIITEDFPIDHPFQRGIFWAWPRIYIGNESVGNGWELEDFEQQINEIEFFANKDGTAVFKTEVVWKSDKWKRLGEKVPYMKENNVITIHPKQNNYRKIDFEIHLLALEEDLSIGGSESESGYGGFSVRMILPDDIKFSGPDGEIIPEFNQVKSKGYVNISGSWGTNKTNGGIVIADNPEYPQNWILREKNSVQNAVFPGDKTIPVSTVDPIVLKYSLIVYSGKLSDRKIHKIISNY